MLLLALCGDVMTGRGVDQILPHPGDPAIHESYLGSAGGYVELAEAGHGPLRRPVDFAYVWGDALAEFERLAPDVKVVNLETAVTSSDDYWPGKGIHYRMHPANISCLSAARIHCCVLANNHVLDWGYAGLEETLETLRQAHVETAGAGQDAEEAAAPAVLEVGGKGRVVVFAFGSESSGIPRTWGAAPGKPGVNLLRDFSADTIRAIARRVHEVDRARTIVVASIHWGENWGYAVPRWQREFAHGLIDEAGVDVVHGHSSHHPKGIEVYRDRPIVYGCGDLLNDYEGIGGHEEFRSELTLIYFLRFDPSSGRLIRLDMTPCRLRRFRVSFAEAEEAAWLSAMLNRTGKEFGTRVETNRDRTLTLAWERGGAALRV